jgi:hypothetical protein
LRSDGDIASAGGASAAAAAAAFDYTVAGLHIRSDVEVPAWTRRGDAEGRVADVMIRWPAPVPAIGGLTALTPLVSARTDGTARIAIPDVAVFTVLGGRYVGVHPDPQATDEDIHCFLLGPVWSILCHQRGLLPLHAACVRSGDRVLAFAGPSGMGKSLLAAGLDLRGYPLLCDDAATFDAGETTIALLETASQAKLWIDSVEGLGLDRSKLAPVRRGKGRLLYRPAQPSAGWGALSLGALYFPTPAGLHAPGLKPLRLPGAVEQILYAVCCPIYAQHVGLHERIKSAAIAIARNVACARLVVATDEPLADAVGRVEQIVRS